MLGKDISLRQCWVNAGQQNTDPLTEIVANFNMDKFVSAGGQNNFLQIEDVTNNVQFHNLRGIFQATLPKQTQNTKSYIKKFCKICKRKRGQRHFTATEWKLKRRPTVCKTCISKSSPGYRRCKGCRNSMPIKEFNIWLHNRKSLDHAQCNMCTTKAALEYDETLRSLLQHDENPLQSTNAYVKNTEAANPTVSVLCGVCNYPRDILFETLWERDGKHRFRFLYCRGTCKRSRRLCFWCLPGSDHEEAVTQWLKRHWHNDISFFKHQTQPTTATLDLFQSTKNDKEDQHIRSWFL